MIRPFVPDDTEALIALWLECSLAAHDFIPPAYWKEHADDLRRHYLPLCDTLVCVDDDSGDMAAFASLVDSYLAALFVAPAQQGRGLGSRLLDLAVRMHPDLDLAVYARNVRAVRFYERRGFQVVRERLEAATGQRELIMMRPPAI